MNSDSNSVDASSEPSVKSVYDYLVYGLSLPERTLRGTAAVVGGAIHESAALLIPSAFRGSRSYQTFVQQMLDMLAKDMGGVGAMERGDEGDLPAPAGQEQGERPQVEQYVARKAVGSFVDLAGMATMHLSPLTLLAVISDVAYGSKTYLHELANELKREGVIAADSTIDSAADLLDAIGHATGQTAEVLDLPPLSVDGMRETISRTKENVAQIDPTRVLPESEIKRLWQDMKTMADRENVSLFEISSAMTMYSLNRVTTVGRGALTTVRVTGNLLDQHLFEHYWDALGEIGRRGIYGMLADTSRPYIEAVWYNFGAHRPTVTEDLLSGKLIGRVWKGFRDWISADAGSGHEPPDDASEPT